MDSSNQSNVLFMDAWQWWTRGICCLSGPPKIEGGNEEDKGNIMGKGMTKFVSIRFNLLCLQIQETGGWAMNSIPEEI